IFLYSNNIAEKVKSISPYLVKNTDVIVYPASHPPEGLPPLVMGNKPADGGNLILSQSEVDQLMSENAKSQNFIKKYVSADDYINGNFRYCLWIEPENEAEAKAIPFIKKRTDRLYRFRLESTAKSTRDYANYDYRFRQISYKSTDGIVVPRVSS